MKYEAIAIHPPDLYSIGHDLDTGTYLLEVVRTWIVWYSDYYRISEAEFEAAKADITSIRDLALDCVYHRAGDRMFYSEAPRPPTP